MLVGIYTLVSLISTLDLPRAEKTAWPFMLGTHPKYIIISEPWFLARPGEDATRGRVLRQVSGGRSEPFRHVALLSPEAVLGSPGPGQSFWSPLPSLQPRLIFRAQAVQL